MKLTVSSMFILLAVYSHSVAQPQGEIAFTTSWLIPQSEYATYAGQGIGFGGAYYYYLDDQLAVGIRLEYSIPGEATSERSFTSYGYTRTFRTTSNPPSHTIITGSIRYFSSDRFDDPSFGFGIDIGGLTENVNRPAKASLVMSPYAGARIVIGFDLFLDLGIRYVYSSGLGYNITYGVLETGISIAL